MLENREKGESTVNTGMKEDARESACGVPQRELQNGRLGGGQLRAMEGTEAQGWHVKAVCKDSVSHGDTEDGEKEDKLHRLGS